MALDSTPSEFSEEGLMLNPDYIEKLFGIRISDPSILSENNPKLKNLIIPNNKIEDNGKAPSALNINLKGDTITWNAHKEKDVIGYRVYKDGKKVKSIKAENTLSFKAGNGTFIVKAVDIAGKESKDSNEIVIGKPQETQQEKNEKSNQENENKNIEKKDNNPTAEKKENNQQDNTEQKEKANEKENN